ncbi:MAG: NAD-dependent epimerase/dehydratase family protein [Bacteroidetes bacterium]|nr:NAD-dependent epimerase/dehydratase family protein [Bacteroidota bacterium]MBK9672366.1 NAD-dependent epimerase/dehydratase family protein [Bacteroidota bacterium]MBK9799987.1 NAD-dependent epimerase/dehydratase family protein [Bacteroidota bacterium]MBP6414052.1 NAD-dependent epimerase/dehydratase family protein [Bacteroidia bacterium]
MKVLLTGADGFLGSNITRELLKQGYEVRAFHLPHQQTATLQDLPIERYEGNLLNIQDIEKALVGCDAIIHAAASTSVWPTRNATSWKINVEATKNCITAALSAKVKRFVYVGTANSFGFGTKANPGNEEGAYNCDQYKLDYMDSKKAAQQLVLKAVKEQQLPAVIVNPCFMFGPYDSIPGPGAMIVSICKNQIPGYTSGGRNYTAVKDVAQAIVNAIKQGRIGECYILGNANLSYREIFDLIAETTGSKHPKTHIPTLLAKTYGGINSLIGRISGRAPKVSYPLAQIACDTHYYSSDKAIRELGLQQSDLKQAIAESYGWLKTNGKLD